MNDDFAAALARVGLDLLGWVPAERWDAVARPGHRPAELLAGAQGLLVVGNGGRRLWDAFLADLRVNPRHLADEPHPLDAFVRRSVARADARLGALPRRWLFADEQADVHIDFRSLGVLAGLGAPSRLGLLLHPRYGPWMGLRAACVLGGTPAEARLGSVALVGAAALKAPPARVSAAALAGPAALEAPTASGPAAGSAASVSGADALPEVLADVHPEVLADVHPDVRSLSPTCLACAAPCVAACPGDAFRGGRLDVGRCAAFHRASARCAQGCDARLACPEGADARYPDEAIRYHSDRRTGRNWLRAELGLAPAEDRYEGEGPSWEPWSESPSMERKPSSR